MCGATQQQTDISDEQQQFYKTLSDEYSTIFGQSQGITVCPDLSLPPDPSGRTQPDRILALRRDRAPHPEHPDRSHRLRPGPARHQPRFSPPVAGGNTMLPSSVTSNILAQNANAAAATRAQGENTITQANYRQGYQQLEYGFASAGIDGRIIEPERLLRIGHQARVPQPPQPPTR